MLDREIAETAFDDAAIKRLHTITGVNPAVSAGLVGAIGDIGQLSDDNSCLRRVFQLRQSSAPRSDRA
ncbi:hypothetical protein [Rhizobium gallicum]|uniref:hypothetical protein n=1 Tax=Rhizobium gallicum TaxID=56730 RepID=UPI001EF875EA|nr:hypothetical protein [Rhizobium gallicum]ULJ74455.1 hypothetical protein L2W42_21590 [Rhizobium gallicum]